MAETEVQKDEKISIFKIIGFIKKILANKEVNEVINKAEDIGDVIGGLFKLWAKLF